MSRHGTHCSAEQRNAANSNRSSARRERHQPAENPSAPHKRLSRGFHATPARTMQQQTPPTSPEHTPKRTSGPAAQARTNVPGPKQPQHRRQTTGPRTNRRTLTARTPAPARTTPGTVTSHGMCATTNRQRTIPATSSHNHAAHRRTETRNIWHRHPTLN